EHIEQGPDTPLAGGAVSTRELEWMVENELVVRLADIVLRRTSLAFTGDVDEAVLEQLAAALAPLLGWDRARTDAEVDRTRALLNERHGLALPSPARG
ncbi:glycerol-3-phosphate dehydrogenase C-terminal domain-containing protein, partial [Microbacterium resistens]